MISITNKIFSMLSFFIGIALIVFVVGIQGQSFNEAVVLGVLLIYIVMTFVISISLEINLIKNKRIAGLET